MSSPTLEIIMRYWSEPLPETEGTLDLPFDIESFCRDNDTVMEIRDKRIAELEAECKENGTALNRTLLTLRDAQAENERLRKGSKDRG